jgi:putative flippase GtrA
VMDSQVMRVISKEFFRFIFVGAINTVSTYGIYAFLLLFVTYPIAYTISFVCGILISFFLNSRFVFRTEMSLAKLVQYPLVYIAQYAVGALGLLILVEGFNISELVAPFFVIGVTVPLTFMLSRWILKERSLGQITRL